VAPAQVRLETAFALNLLQIRFIDTIITYLTKNGTIDKEILFEPPFTDQHDQGIMGIFTSDAEVRRIIQIIDRINANAEVA
jgi:type I restriction enzyme R subunit